jgi:hypothetical protein
MFLRERERERERERKREKERERERERESGAGEYSSDESQGYVIADLKRSRPVISNVTSNIRGARMDTKLDESAQDPVSACVKLLQGKSDEEKVAGDNIRKWNSFVMSNT